MAKPNFTLPNKPAIKSGSILSYNYTDDFTFVPAPLTFNRDSAATRVNEKGLIEDVGYFGSELVQNGDFSEIGPELVTNGNFDTDSDWTKVQATISNGEATITSPDGSYAAIYQDILTVGKIYKYRVEVKSVTNNIVIYSGVGTDVEITEEGTYEGYIKANNNLFELKRKGGTVTSAIIDNVSVKEVGQNWTLTQATVEDGKLLLSTTDGSYTAATQTLGTIGNLYRITLDVSDIVGTISVAIGGGTDIDITTNGTHTFEIISASTTFEVKRKFGITNVSATIDNISVIEILGDKPRIDYSDSLTEPSLLLEPQRTNLIAYSEDFSQWTLQSGTTVTSNTTETLSPSGEYNASKIAGNGTNGLFKASVGTGGGTNTKSIYIKGTQSGQVVYIKDPNETVNNKPLTLTTDWQRYTLTESQTSSFGIWINAIPSSGIYMWGAQLETGSYATSYIPTAGSTATRLGETANNAGDVNVFNSEEGVLYAELSTNFEASGGVKAVSVQYDVNNYVAIYFRNDNNLSARVVGSGNVTQVDTTYAINTFYKIAVSYNSTNVKFYVNGTQVDIDTTNTLPTSLNKVSFNRGSTSSLTEMEGKVRNVQVFNKALTDRELEILTIQ